MSSLDRYDDRELRGSVQREEQHLYELEAAARYYQRQAQQQDQ